MRWKETLAVLGVAASLTGLVLGVRQPRAPAHKLLPAPDPPPGYRVDQVTYDTEGNPWYSYVKIGEDETPPAEEDEEDVLIAQAMEKYRDELRARLEAETRYEFRSVAPGGFGSEATPGGVQAEPTLPLAMESVFVHVFVSRPQLVTAMRDIVPIVLNYDPSLNRVGFIFCVPTNMYAEACVYASEVADIDWDKAAEQIQREDHVRLGKQGHIAVY